MANHALCPICTKIVNDRCNSIFCDICKNWVHAKCNSLSSSDFRSLAATSECENWFCAKCTSEIFPLNGDNTPGLPQQHLINRNAGLFEPTPEIRSFTTQVNDLSNTVDQINCKYYTTSEFKTEQPKSKTFSFLHLNCASLSRHFEELNELLVSLEHEFGIIGISESRILKHNLSTTNFDIPNYTAVHTPTEANAGGVSLFISNSLSFKTRTDLSKLCYNTKTLESVFVEVISGTKKRSIVGCIYKHPCLPMNEFNTLFLAPLLHKANVEGKAIFLLGDFNCDLLKCDSDTEVQQFLDIMGSNSLCPQITLPTRISNTSKTIIDNIFCSPIIGEHYFSGNIFSGISDHLPQFLIIGKLNTPKATPIFKRQWSKFDREKFILDYFEIDWDKSLNLNKGDINSSFDVFVKNVERLLDVHAPMRKLTKKETKTLNKPWITPGILNSIKVRNSLLARLSKSNTRDNTLHDRYKAYRNLIVTLIRRSKTNFYKEYFQSNLNNSKKIWQGIREIISISSNKSKAPISLLIDDNLTSNASKVADSMNTFFNSVASSIRQNLHAPPVNFKSFLKNPIPNSFFIRPTSPIEVQNLINSLSNSKSTGPHSIPVKILKLLIQDISKHLTDLFNLSFSTGVFPSILKTSKVVPIFKNKGSPTDVSNYRPISLLSNLDKLIEKLISKRLVEFLDNHQLISKHQFGFRSKHSTEHALLSLTETIRRSLDSGQFSCGVFIDLQKAFDTVDHDILISKLKHYGIRGIASKWFRSYLTKRKQFVEISGYKSMIAEILFGVPQGSVLGPLLFLLYINDLHNSLRYSTPFLFADDTSLLNSGKNISSISKQVNTDLKLLVRWLNANKISLNASKTELILFRSKTRTVNISELKIKINGRRLYPTPSVKYLGIHLDEHLTWDKHINELSGKLRRANGALSKLRHLMPRQIILNTYFAIFHSHLKYGCQVWGQSYGVNRIFLLQKAALRIISFSQFQSPSTPLFKQANILKLGDIIDLLNICLVHQCLNQVAPIQLCSLLNLSTLPQLIRTRGVALKTLIKPCVKTTLYGLKSLTLKCISVWNKMLQAHPDIDFTNITFTKLRSITRTDITASY